MGTLVRQARRRILGNQLIAQGANAGSAAFAAFILLLLLGTQILNWPVALSIPLVAIAVGLFQVRRHMPSPYAVAQTIDRRLGLADRISTALFFNEVRPESRVDADIRRAQFDEASEVARSVDVRRAVPYTMPRGVYFMAAMAIVAGSLFALRYGLSRELDLKQPLASFLPESLTGGKPVRQANNTRRNVKQTPETPDDGSTAENQEDQQKAGEPDNPEAQTPAETPNEAAAKMDAKTIPIEKQAQQPDNEMASDDGDSQAESTDGKGDENKDGQQGEGKSGQNEKKEGGKQDSKDASDSSSLMSKMKDAFQNLLSKAKPQQNQEGQAQQGKDQKSAQSKAQQGSKQNGKDDKQQNGQQQGDAQEGEDGQEAKNSENAQQGKGQGKSDSQQSSKQPGSGIGSQDGEKAIKNAEQLAAMGKLSEIMGKRSATISGEATVEVQTTNQQLHTRYEQKGTQHTQGGAEINRDEVPVSLQPYVQQYFEQVRKQAAGAPAAPSVRK